MSAILNCIKNIFKIAKLLSVDDSDNLRFGMISTLGKNQKILIFSPYGLMHSPPADSMVLMWSQQGRESNGIGIADDPKNRTLKDLAEGEVALGNYLTGSYILFDQQGGCQIVSNSLTHNGTNVGDTHSHEGSPTAPDGAISNTGEPI
jgi:phage gp45-like